MRKAMPFSPILLLLLLAVGSCKEIFEKSLDKESVTLSAPGNNISSTLSDQYFFWQPVDSGVSYELQIVTPRFDSILRLVVDTVTERNTLSLSLDTASYQWRVRAFNASSSTPFSAPWALTINHP